MRKIDVAERRARIARRHGIAPGHRASGVVDATERVVCLHASDPATVYLSAWARIDGFRRDDLDRALYEDRSLVKHMAMRRTMHVFTRAALPDVQAGASDRVAGQERGKLIREVEKAGLHADGAAWLERACDDVAAYLEDGREASSRELRDALPSLAGGILHGEGTTWAAETPIGPRVLIVVSTAGRTVRAGNDGGWNVARHRWARMESWLGEDVEPRSQPEAEEALVARWLRAFGPGTEVDLKWWLGSTLTGVRKALATLGAVEVELDGGRTGYLLPDDAEPEAPVEPWGALLPPLDPTVMGWSERDWYLGDHKAALFDRTGNAGPTTWWDGRIVGGWRQDAAGEVVVQLLEDVGADARAVLEAEATRLSAWLEGQRVQPRFPSPLSKADVG